MVLDSAIPLGCRRKRQLVFARESLALMNVQDVRGGARLFPTPLDLVHRWIWFTGSPGGMETEHGRLRNALHWIAQQPSVDPLVQAPANSPNGDCAERALVTGLAFRNLMAVAGHWDARPAGMS